MTIHIEPTDLVGVEHRTLAFARYDGTAFIDVPGELLTVTQDPTAPHAWCAWYTANRNPDIIPTSYVVAALTPGMTLPPGEWRFLCTSGLWVFFVAKVNGGAA